MPIQRIRNLAMLTALLLIPGGITIKTQAAEPKSVAVMQELPLKAVQIDDPFWSPRQSTVRNNAIPNSWQYLQSPITELKQAAETVKKPTAEGMPWLEANLHKTLETAAYALAQQDDPALDKKVDEMIALIAAAQQSDGFIHAWPINRPNDFKPWSSLFALHDGYVTGHLVEAALAHHQATGKTNYLDIARKAADQAHNHFITRKNPGFCGHAEFELALVELYRLTGNRNYLDLAREFIERRGHTKQWDPQFPYAYYQDDLPVREQQSINGHAVRAVFFATGVADVALESGDADYRDAATRLWQSATQRKMYLTGGVGSTAKQEAFGPDYDLPNNGYCESCANCGLVNFAQRMLRLDGDASAADELERGLYNAVLHGIALDGRTTYYQNPLSDRDHLRDNTWVCCPPMLSRTLMEVGRYAYGYSESDVYVNLFVGGRCDVPLKASPVTFTIQTKYPWDGRVRIEANPKEASEFALHLRIPGWCRGVTIRLNGERIKSPTMTKGYAVIRRVWQAGDGVELDLPMPVMRVEAHPSVKADAGMVAIQRGPIVYALEGLDNAGTALVRLPSDPQFKTEYRQDLLGGVTVVKGVTVEGKPFTAIPYYALANRGRSLQEVWQNQAGKTEELSGWEGKLYREYPPVHTTGVNNANSIAYK